MTVELDPIQVDMSAFVAGGVQFDVQYQIRDIIDDKLQIDSFVHLREKANRLICLLPSAQPSSAPQQNPIFHRWSWYKHFPDCHVMVLSDPGLYLSSDIRAAWFMGSQVDIVEALASHVARISERLGIAQRDVVFYGSSMGGFGALMVAAELADSTAVAEVPQLDMRLYPVPGAIRDLEDKVIGCSLEVYYADYPHRVSVADRFKRTRTVPRFRIVTNRADPGFSEQMEFVSNLGVLSNGAKSISDHEVLILADEVGHKPLPTGRGIEILRATMGLPLKSVEQSSVVAVPPSTPSYAELIEGAVAAIGNIKFIRTDAEKDLYERAKADLYLAAGIDKSADWPYRRLCSLIKLWTNSFNDELLQAAREAFRRKQTLEAFIYICRGTLYNFPTEQAEALVRDVIGEVKDPEIANIGRIFLALCRYEGGDYSGYSSLIRKFRLEKRDGFDPYIAVPVSTVITEGYESLESHPSEVSLLGTRLDNIPTIPGSASYVIAVSCDEVYFRNYAKYIVDSFSMTCADEAALIISVIAKDGREVSSLLASWKAKNVILNVVDVAAGQNVGPIASLIRFATVYPLLSKLKVPVVVLDLDCVLTRPLGTLIAKHNDADLCSRILGGGVAPWEKFTGGFAIFYPTKASLGVAGFIASAAKQLASSGSKQWWIDQNCFEAGIRMVLQRGGGLRLDNVIAERDAYCVMPVGSGESKIHVLDRALQQLITSRVSN